MWMETINEMQSNNGAYNNKLKNQFEWNDSISMRFYGTWKFGGFCF